MPLHKGLFDKVGGGLSTLFGGRADPRLSDEENKAASSDALIQSGLATLLASGRDGFSPTVLQSISQGILAGREAGTLSRDNATQRNQQDQLQQLVDSGQVGSELLQDMFMQAIVNGDADAMRALSGVLPAVLGAKNTPSRSQIITRGDPEDDTRVITELINMVDGRVIESYGSAKKATGSTAALARYNRLGPDGERRGVWQIQPDGGERFLGYTETLNSSGPERINAQLGQAAMQAMSLLDTVDGELASIMPTLVIRGGPIIAAVSNMTLNDDQQAAVLAASNFINPVVRYLSGAQMTDKEAQRYYAALIPSVGDNERAIKLKRVMRRNIASAMGQGKWAGTASRDAQGNIVHDFANADAWLANAQREAEAEVSGEGILEPATADVAGFEDLIPGRN